MGEQMESSSTPDRRSDKQSVDKSNLDCGDESLSRQDSHCSAATAATTAYGDLASTAASGQPLKTEKQSESTEARITWKAWTISDCVKRVSDIFPGISRCFVAKLYRWQALDYSTTIPEAYGNIIEHIASLTRYPTQKDEDAEKQASLRASRKSYHSAALRLHGDREFQQIAAALLKRAFRDIPEADIDDTVMSRNFNLPVAFVTLAEARDSNDPGALVTHKRQKTSFDEFSQYDGSNRKVKLAQDLIGIGQREMSKRRKERYTEMQQLRREREAQAGGQVAECACCFASDVPLWKTIHCTRDPPHHFCFTCARKNAETELEMGRCRPHCIALDGCKAPFAEQQLRLCLDKNVAKRLAKLQQQEDVKAAALEDVDECSFCDYMAICPSAFIDREFRCQNEECMKVSCRLCRTETHIPLNCDEAAAQRSLNHTLDARHEVEEAMSRALVRKCNKCKRPFIKTRGCNSMICPVCGNRQCYVCHQNVDSYEHFGIVDANQCPLTDEQDVEVRHLKDIEDAELKAKERILNEKPHIKPSELNITTSENVKQARTDAGRLIASERPVHHARPEHQFAVPACNVLGQPQPPIYAQTLPRQPQQPQQPIYGQTLPQQPQQQLWQPVDLHVNRTPRKRPESWLHHQQEQLQQQHFHNSQESQRLQSQSVPQLQHIQQPPNHHLEQLRWLHQVYETHMSQMGQQMREISQIYHQQLQTPQVQQTQQSWQDARAHSALQMQHMQQRAREPAPFRFSAAQPIYQLQTGLSFDALLETIRADTASAVPPTAPVMQNSTSLVDEAEENAANGQAASVSPDAEHTNASDIVSPKDELTKDH